MGSHLMFPVQYKAVFGRRKSISFSSGLSTRDVKDNTDKDRTC